MKTGLILYLLCFSCAMSGETNSMDKLQTRLQNQIKAFPQATVAVAYQNLSNHDVLFINEKEMMHAASTMKVPVMIEVFKQADEGKIDLRDSLLVKNEFRSIVDSSLYSMDIGEDSDESIYNRIGQKMSVYDLTYQMITVSSNLATNLLIDLVGANNVMQTMAEIGAHNIRVLRGVEDMKAYQAGLNNTTNAYDLMLIISAIAKKTIVTPAACDQMLEILSQQKFREKIPGLLPADVRVANKTGSITAIDHDCAIVYPPDGNPYVLIVLTKGIEDHEQAHKLIARISKIIYEFQQN